MSRYKATARRGAAWHTSTADEVQAADEVRARPHGDRGEGGHELHGPTSSTANEAGGADVGDRFAFRGRSARQPGGLSPIEVPMADGVSMTATHKVGVNSPWMPR
ncbi:unnamed protein product [Calypogeia fissa]